MSSPTHIPEPLAAQWQRLLLPFGTPDPAITAALADLTARYSEPSRHYHNLTHLQEVLSVISSFAGAEAHTTAVGLAAWFHDAVYDSRANDNEERSADLAEAVLIPLGLPPDLVANVRRLVMLTKTHRAAADDREGHLLLDADLAILGAEEGRYDDYARAIHREYAWVAEDAYCEGRCRVLEGFLKRPRIYLTDALLCSHEERARHNLRRELDLLNAMRQGAIPVKHPAGS
jgi:predicted metal-dependent HD superfamily phosphohydrolase